MVYDFAEGPFDAQSEPLRFSDLRRVAGAILTPIVPVYRRHFYPGQLQFITTSTYRRAAGAYIVRLEAVKKSEKSV